MNNDTYRTADLTNEEVDQESINKAQATATRLRVSLSRLLANEDFRFVIKEIITPRFNESLKILKTNGVIEIQFREQGAIRELEYLMEGLSSTLESLKNTIDHGEPPQTIEQLEREPETPGRKRTKRTNRGK